MPPYISTSRHLVEDLSYFFVRLGTDDRDNDCKHSQQPRQTQVQKCVCTVVTILELVGLVDEPCLMTLTDKVQPWENRETPTALEWGFLWSSKAGGWGIPLWNANAVVHIMLHKITN